MESNAPEVELRRSENTDVGEAVLTEAVRHVDIIHTSLVGMTAMVIFLTGALFLPVFGLHPVVQTIPIIVIGLTVLVGITVLYLMNFRVHQHVAGQAALTEVLVNSLGQGFLNFDHKGICAPVYSQACLDLLETVPSGKHISDVLRVPEDRLSDFKDWMDVLYMPGHALSFEDITAFLPQYYPHSEGRRVHLAYRPIRDKNRVLKQVVLIATDETEEYMAIEKAKQQQAFADMIFRIFKDRNQFHVSLKYLRDFIAASNSPDLTLRDSHGFLQQLHTLKAAVRHFSLLSLGDIIQQMETDLRSPGITTDKQFRQQLLAGRQKLSTELDRIIGEFQEIIGTENDFGSVLREIDETQLYVFSQRLLDSNVGKELVYQFLVDIVAVPFQQCMRAFDRDLSDLINAMNKRIKPIIYRGTNPRVLALPLQDFFFALLHIGRNIADHGIEAPAVRIAHGKDAAGQITVESYIVSEEGKGDTLFISISDDGDGIDPNRVREKLSLFDPEGSWREEDDHEVIQHIFSGGFTTRETVTELSGRGVGMDAVENEVKKLGGSISVSSVRGRGTCFDIKIPYSVEIAFELQKKKQGF